MASLSDRAGRGALLVASWLALAFLAFPLVVVVAISFSTTEYLKFPPVGFTLRWYDAFFSDRSFVESLWTSAKLAAASTLVALSLGIPAGLVLARKTFPGKQAVTGLFLSPLVLPTIVIGVAILQYATQIGVARTFWALLLGHVVLVLPYVMRTTLASLSGFDISQEEAAQDLGATSFKTFFLVTLPQIKPGIIAGGLFAFIISWIDVEVAVFNSTPELITIPVKMFNYVQFNIDPILAATSAITIYVAIATVLVLDSVIGIEKATTRTTRN